MKMLLLRILPRTISAATLSALASLAPMPASAAVDCVALCGVDSCDLTDGRNKPLTVRRDHGTHVEECPNAMSKDNKPVFGLYQTAKGPERFKVTQPNTRFAVLVPPLAHASCAVGAACLEDRDASRVGGKGGKGADDDRTVRSGKPCEAGLPCGPILLPKQSLSIDVAGVATGQFTLTPKRGAGSGATTLPLRDGRIELPASALVAGGVYGYSLQGSGGEPLRGEFSVLSPKMQADVERALADVRRSEPDSAALGEIQILLEEKLQWDAMQRTR